MDESSRSRASPPQTCSKCGETKATTDFYVSRYLSTGLHSQCKKCVRAGQEKRVRCPPEEAAASKVCRCALRPGAVPQGFAETV